MKIGAATENLALKITPFKKTTAIFGRKKRAAYFFD